MADFPGRKGAGEQARDEIILIAGSSIIGRAPEMLLRLTSLGERGANVYIPFFPLARKSEDL
jgi:hypothetical protein